MERSRGKFVSTKQKQKSDIFRRNNSEDNPYKNVPERRIVDLRYFGEQFDSGCETCGAPFLFRNIKNETLRGFCSVLKVECYACFTETNISTSGVSRQPDGDCKYYPYTVNIKAALGIHGEQTNTIAGLVASSLISILFFLLILAFIIMAFFWRKLIHDTCTSRGKMRVPRETEQTEVMSDEIFLEDRRSVHNGGLPPVGINRYSHINRAYTPDQWYPSVKSSTNHAYAQAYEVKQTPVKREQEQEAAIDFEEEEEPVIVANIYPEEVTGNDPQTTTITVNQAHNLDVFVPFETQQQQQTVSASQEQAEDRKIAENIRRTTLKDWRVTQQNNDPDTTDLHTNTRPYSGTHLRTTVPISTASGNDIIISPMVPSSGGMQDMDDGEAVMAFDGDDEDGRPMPAWGHQEQLLF